MHTGLAPKPFHGKPVFKEQIGVGVGGARYTFLAVMKDVDVAGKTRPVS